MQPDYGRHSCAPGHRGEYRVRPRGVKQESIKLLLYEQLVELVPGSEHGQRPADANRPDGIDRSRNACEFAAQPPLKAQSELLLQLRTMLRATGQRGQNRLYAAVEIPAMNVKHAHQFLPPASLR